MTSSTITSLRTGVQLIDEIQIATTFYRQWLLIGSATLTLFGGYLVLAYATPILSSSVDAAAKTSISMRKIAENDCATGVRRQYAKGTPWATQTWDAGAQPPMPVRLPSGRRNSKSRSEPGASSFRP